jgi:lysine/ornithine N-monooxygenase
MILYDWIVIGGGVHGCTVATFLLKKGKVTTEKLRIIDPHSEPMYQWRRNTELIGMEFLRSPGVHQMDTDPYSLQKFVRKQKRNKNEFYGKYKRPALRLFNDHCDFILNEVDIKHSWYQGFVNSIKKHREIWKIKTASGELLEAKNIVLTISINDQLNLPNWVEQVKSSNLSNQVFHIYDNHLTNLENLQAPIAVIGGGITAAHLCIKLSAMFPGRVNLVKRHPFRVHDFDSDPGWLGPKNLASFHKISNYEERRRIIQQARNKGSLPQELFHKLKRLERENKLAIINGEIGSAYVDEENKLILKIENNEIRANSVILATGFLPSLPGKNWIAKLVEEQGLKCAACGYPVINKSLQWCPHLYVSGPLAELEIGPIARNISGARQAAEKIVYSL